MANTSESAIVLDQVGLDERDIGIGMVILVNLMAAVGVWVMLTIIRNMFEFIIDGGIMHLLPVEALFSSYIGICLIVGISHAALLALCGFNWIAIAILVLLELIFAPIYTATGVTTIYEYTLERFGGHRIRIYLSVLPLLVYIFANAWSEYWCYAITMANSSESVKVLDQVELKGSAMVVLFLFLKIAVELWAVFTLIRNNRGIVNGFVMAGRNIHRFAVGACLLSGNIGNGLFVGVAGMGATAGIAVGAFDWNAMIILVLLGWIFAPIYTSTGVTTIPEYTRGRSGGQRIRIYLSVLPLFVYIFTSVSANLIAGTLFLNQVLDWNIYFTMILLLSITWIMFTGGFAMMILAFIDVVGYEELQKFMNAASAIFVQNQSCGVPRAHSFNVFRDAVARDLLWSGLTFGLTILATRYWYLDQVLVQSQLAADSLIHVKGGSVFAGLLKILPTYMMVMVGMIGRVVFVGC